MTTDWQQLATDLGSLRGNVELGGDRYARAALEHILGDAIDSAVEVVLGGGPGSELAMNVLRYVQSERAIRLAHEAYQVSSGLRAANAVFLMKHIAHPCSVPWISELLRDPGVAGWAVGLIDQLLWCERVELQDVEPMLVQAEQHERDDVRKHAAFIREYLAHRLAR